MNFDILSAGEAGLDRDDFSYLLLSPWAYFALIGLVNTSISIFNGVSRQSTNFQIDIHKSLCKVTHFHVHQKIFVKFDAMLCKNISLFIYIF